MEPDPTLATVDAPGPTAAATVRPAEASLSSIKLNAAIAFVAAVGVVIAAYLAWVTLREAAAPAGCGPASGCAEVLASRWSRWFDLPVAVPAVAVYLSLTLAALVARGARSAAVRRGARAALVIFATVAAGAAAWFVTIQVVALRAFCPWCLALHACGVVIFALVWLGGRQGHVPDAIDNADAAMTATAPERRASLHLTGLLAVGVLIGGQLLSKSPAPRINLGGPLGMSVAPGEHPLIGSPDAKHVIYVLADYTCPHCRTLRQQLDAAAEHFGRDQLAVAMVPVPMNADCNDTVERTGVRQRDACDLARVALAVWAAEPGKFAELDRWLFAPEDPPSAEQAREHAAALVGGATLERFLATPGVERQIERNVDLYKAAGKGRLPKMILPGHVTEGEAEDTPALFELLEKHLGLTAPAASRPTTP